MRYEEYKDSGVGWIGEVPSHWTVMPLKRTGTFGNGLTYSPNDVCEDDGILVLRSSNIQNDKLCFDDNVYVNDCPKELIVKPGDIIICSRNGSASLVGKCAIVEKELNATFGAFMMRYSPLSDASKRFSFYMLQSALKFYKGLYSTTTINQLTKAVIEQITVSYPPYEEQQAIASYLDEKCGKINGAIVVQKKKIDLLNELKQTIITNAVTKGLKPDAPMKDSGVEWIGEIPENWQLKKIKFLTSCNDDTLSEDTDDNLTIKYVEIGDVSNVKGIKINTEYTFKEAPSRARRITKINDVIVSTVRTYLKAVARINEEDLVVSTGFAVLRPNQIDESFLEYAVLSEKFLAEIVSKSVGVSYPAINSVELINIKIPVPSQEEQLVIANFIKEKVKDIDAQISKANRRIELLNELKQSIITEAVTGKIKVV